MPRVGNGEAAAYERARRAADPEAARARDRARYAANPEAARARDRARYAANGNAKRERAASHAEMKREFVDSLKSVPCKDCGGTFHPSVMEFDHVRGEKAKCVSKLWNGSVLPLLIEAAKCDVVCANCHRMRTHVERDHGKWTRDKRKA